MSVEILESDWKQLRGLHERAVERFCQRILDEVQNIGSDTTKDAHQRYLDTYKLIQDRDEEIAEVFDDLRRSNALVHLGAIRYRNLMTEEEFQLFSPETRSRIDALLA